MTDTTQHHRTATTALPTMNLDYTQGRFTNTMTGETTKEIRGIILGSRTDLVLWPALSQQGQPPECVNGSVHGPCLHCAFQAWDGTLPPLCSEELSVLIYHEEQGQAVVLTGRRSQARVLDRYLGMKAQLTGMLHDQRVIIGMQAEGVGDLHRLIVRPQGHLTPDELGHMQAMADRMKAQGLFEVL